MPRHPPYALHSLSPHTQTNTTKKQTNTTHPTPQKRRTGRATSIRANSYKDARVHYPTTKQPPQPNPTPHQPQRPMQPAPDPSGPNSVPPTHPRAGHPTSKPRPSTPPPHHQQSSKQYQPGPTTRADLRRRLHYPSTPDAARTLA